jgi:hypothetical protein
MKEDLVKYFKQMIEEGYYDEDNMVGDCELISNLLHVMYIIESTDEEMIKELTPTITDVVRKYEEVR